jgi:hypothetical protein
VRAGGWRGVEAPALSSQRHHIYHGPVSASHPLQLLGSRKPPDSSLGIFSNSLLQVSYHVLLISEGKPSSPFWLPSLQLQSQHELLGLQAEPSHLLQLSISNTAHMCSRKIPTLFLSLGCLKWLAGAFKTLPRLASSFLTLLSYCSLEHVSNQSWHLGRILLVEAASPSTPSISFLSGCL